MNHHSVNPCNGTISETFEILVDKQFERRHVGT